MAKRRELSNEPAHVCDAADNVRCDGPAVVDQPAGTEPGFTLAGAPIFLG
jgi:hypothetical protein